MAQVLTSSCALGLRSARRGTARPVAVERSLIGPVRYKAAGKADDQDDPIGDGEPEPPFIPAPPPFIRPGYLPAEVSAVAGDLTDHSTTAQSAAREGYTTNAGGGTDLGPGLSTINAPLGPPPPVTGLHVPGAVRLAYGALGWVWSAVALICFIGPAVAALVQPPFPMDVSALVNPWAWGFDVSLIPLAVTTMAFKGVLDSDMAGARGGGHLGAVVLVACALTLFVTLQATRLQYAVPFKQIVIGLAAFQFVLTAVLMAYTQRWHLPLSKSRVKSALYLWACPVTWTAWGFWAAHLLLTSAGLAVLRLLQDLVPEIQSQPLIVSLDLRSCAALITCGVIFMLLARAADRRLLAARTARTLSLCVAACSLLFTYPHAVIAWKVASSEIAYLTQWKHTGVISFWGICLYMVAALVIGVWSLAAAVVPGLVQGRPTKDPTAKYEPPAGEMTTRQFWEAMAL